MLEGFVPFPDEFVKRYRDKGLWIDKTIGEELDGSIEQYNDRIALACNGQYVTYRELGERATRLALHFIEKGLTPYDRIILQLPNELEFAYIFFAAVKIGIIPIMSLPAHRDAEISFFAQFTKTRAHVMPARFKDYAHQTMSRQIRKHAPVMELQFVSGEPVEEDFISITALLNDKIEERVPVESLKQYRPDPLEPALFQLSGGTTGVPKIIPRTHIGDAKDLLLNTQGAPMFDDDEVLVVDENENEVPYGEPGELLVRGPLTIRGYYNSPEYNQKAFTADGFYRTGDVVRMYKGRYLSVEGRIKDTINRGAEKISAEEVENHILAHPKVENCAFVAMPDRIMGEKGCAFVLTKGNQPLILDELNRFLKEERHIATFKLPERLELVQEFPFTNVGKIDKKELRRIISEKLEREKI